MASVRPGGDVGAEVDHCTPCRLVWFDMLEFHALDRLAWVELLQAMAARPAEGDSERADRLGGTWRCPHCGQTLRQSAALTRYGRYGGRECAQGHGQVLGLTALLASRGLLRPPSTGERVALAREARALHCLSCGAPEMAHDDHCSHCESPLLMLDLPRLAVALGHVDEGTAARARPDTAAQDTPALTRWPCHACGQVLDPAVEAHCGQCGHPVLAPLLEDLSPLLAGAQARLESLRDEAMRTALAPLPESERRRIADLTQRPEHHAAAERARHAYWRRYGVVAAAFGTALLVAFCNVR